jgi:tetratricopeptide (TPR) repeat protein
MDGENPVFYYYLGKSQFYLKNYTAAISSFKQVLLFDREHVKSHYELGVTYYILEEMQKAKEEFEVVIASHDKGQKIQPLTFVLSHYWLGKVHHFNGNTKAAVEYMKRVLEFKLKKDFRTKVEKELAKIKSGGE